MPRLVKIITNEYGEAEDDPVWHWQSNLGGSPSVLCSGQIFGEGESSVEFEIKEVARGGITCPHCLSIIKEFKAIKL